MAKNEGSKTQQEKNITFTRKYRRGISGKEHAMSWCAELFRNFQGYRLVALYMVFGINMGVGSGFVFSQHGMDV